MIEAELARLCSKKEDLPVFCIPVIEFLKGLPNAMFFVVCLGVKVLEICGTALGFFLLSFIAIFLAFAKFLKEI